MRGHLVPTPWDWSDDPEPKHRLAQVFYPDPLFDFNPSLMARTVQAVFAAERALLDLQHQLSQHECLPLAAFFAEADALASSAIENLPLTYPELARALLSGKGSQTARLVIGNLQAIHSASALARQPEVTPLAIVGLQHDLLAGTSEDALAGHLRRSWVWIGGVSPLDAQFVPPPRARVEGLLHDLAAFCNRTDLPAVLQAAVAHAQYETIHPHADGNGRAGRALVHTILSRHNLEYHTVAPFSAALWASRQDYYRGLSLFREDQMDEWCTFFANAIEDTALHASRLVDQFLPIRASWQQKLTSLRSDAAARTLLAALPGYPLLNQRQAEHITNASPEATRLAIQTLEHAGILSLAPAPSQRRLWQAPDLMKLAGSFLAPYRLAERTPREI